MPLRHARRTSQKQALRIGQTMSKKAIPDFGDEAGPALHSARWRFGTFELDETRRELCRDGQLQPIEPKPLNLLMLLVRRPAELITKQELVDALWTGRPVSDAVIAGTVARLRVALGEEAGEWIRTVHGFGYRFDAPVTLVDTAEQTSGAIEAPKLALQAGEPPPLRPNWKLLRRLGQSGDTWLAEHAKKSSRRVFKYTRDPHGLSALKREVTIYRLLQQSLGDKRCYVDLHDWNFDEPPYFIEAEHCSGGSLLEWFDSQGGAARVPLDTRIELIARIAEALAEVHRVGVLHKDLKPANVFVVPDDSGIPSIRLADFGASRLIDPDRLARLQITRLGFTQVIDERADADRGTLLYLAPEVVAGQPATVKADIYALGVMLYQLVVGNPRRQLGAGWEVEIDDEILRDDIAAAADNNPERRLADAGELARRLRALGERRQARTSALLAERRAETALRAQERARARRMGLVAAFVAMAIGFATSTALFLDARSARQMAEQQTLLANEAAKRAEDEAGRAEAVSAFLTRDLFAPVTSRAVPVKDMSVSELLAAGAVSVERRFADDPLIAADLHAALGLSFNALEMTDLAEKELERALTGHLLIGGEADLRVVESAAELATVKYAIGRDDQHLVDYERIAASAARVHGSTNASVLRLRSQIAWSKFLRGQLREAAASFSTILDDQMKAGTPDDRAIASTCEGLGRALALYGDYGAAENATRTGLKHAIRAVGARHESVGELHATLALVAIETGRYTLAESEYTAALQIAEAWGKTSSGPRITALTGLARVRLRQKRIAEAIDLAKATLHDIAASGSAFDQSAIIRLVLGEAYSARGSHGLAAIELASALQVSIRNYGADHFCTRRIRLALARNAAAGDEAESVRRHLFGPTPLAFGDLAANHDFNRELATLRTSFPPERLKGPEQSVARSSDAASR